MGPDPPRRSSDLLGVLKLYHCSGSRSFRALWALEEAGLPYELVVMAFPPRTMQEGYRAINPMGTVPAFVDDGRLMTESAAICQYIAERYCSETLAVGRDHRDYPGYLNFLHMGEATLTFPQTIVLRYSALEPHERNTIRLLFLYRPYRSMIVDWEHFARGMLSTFRAARARARDKTPFDELVEDLSLRSEEFRAWWPDVEVKNFDEGSKRLNHPKLGSLDLTYIALASEKQPDLTITAYIPKPRLEG